MECGPTSPRRARRISGRWRSTRRHARAVLADIGDPGSLHPSRAAWVSTFAGDAAVAYGDLDAALAAYQASLVIRQRLAAADPSNAAWQRDLSVRCGGGFEPQTFRL